jgi:hypothetical protein
MNDFDPQQFERELKSLSPKQPERGTIQRIACELSTSAGQGLRPTASQRPVQLLAYLLRWLIPAAAAATMIALIVSGHRNPLPQPQQPNQFVSAPKAVGLKADKVEIDRLMVTNFDAVARLPSGEPVRFRCEQWTDKVLVRDSAAGLMLEHTTPRLEIVPVRFETY